MKRIGKKKSGDISPDLTSFSDIANLLIIFFILTTTLVRPFGRATDMPSSSKPETQEQKNDTPTVNLMTDRITFALGEGKERELTMNELRSELWKQNFPQKDMKHRTVVMETADGVTWERYYQVATAIAAAGGVIAIIQEDKDEPKK